MIINLRYGWACNSSSTHSLIIAKNEVLNDYDIGDYFGWQFFTAASECSKKEYLANILYHHFTLLNLNHEIIKIIIKGLLPNIDIDQLRADGLDHQSMPSLPRDWDEKGLNLDFFNEYKQFILQRGLAILGGNDNTDEYHELSKKYDSFILPLYYDMGCAEIVAKKDPQFGFWTLFNRKNGNKIRMEFSEHQKPVYKSSIPELVDIKITDYCDRACAFCYQDSTKQGTHADYNYLMTLIYLLSEHQVFEVAIGGGEPTSHPNLLYILQTCKYKKIIPNFTTKSLKWLENKKFTDTVFECIGSIAYSATAAYQIRELVNRIRKYDLPLNKFQIQIIEGLLPKYEFEAIIKECSYNNLPLTILGFKETGRGQGFQQKTNDYFWLDVIKDQREKGNYVRVGVDTLMIQKYEEQLKEEFAQFLMTKKEGEFSCYIDAVKQEIGPSSYMPDQMKPFDDIRFPEFATLFKSF